jgi:methylmalonyl-CoA mutase C-terminal domain/subunit
VFGGGVIPDADARTLKEQGVAHVFGPGSSLKAISSWLEAELDLREVNDVPLEDREIEA